MLCYEYSLGDIWMFEFMGIKARTVVLLPRNVERNALGNFPRRTEAYIAI
jgi:hypothetical protein